MSLGEAVQAVLQSEAVAVVYGVVLMATLDVLTGIAKAVSKGMFQFEWIDQWVRTKLMGRVVPIILLLVFGELAPNIQLGDFGFDVLTTAGYAAAAAYLAAEVASIINNLQPTQPDMVPEGVREPAVMAEHAFVAGVEEPPETQTRP